MESYDEQLQSLTKDQLRELLVSRSVNPPPINARKEDYLNLYLEHFPQHLEAHDDVIVAKQKAQLLEFSTDDDTEQQAVDEDEKREKKKTKKRAENGKNSTILDEEEIMNLTDEQLYDRLKEFGINLGPIVESTRSLYEKKLIMLLTESTDTEQNGEQNESENMNGKETSNGVDKFSADEEETEPEIVEESADESDEQPGLSTSRVSTPSKEQEVYESPATRSSLRNRFGNERERLTPTPRRSIHSYKVTETKRQTTVKRADGSLSKEEIIERTEETKDGSGSSTSQAKITYILAHLPKFFLLLTFLVAVYLLFKANEHKMAASFKQK